MRPSPVARSAAPSGYANTGRVGLKAHPCACNPIRAIPRASRKRLFRPAFAGRKGWVDQKTKHPPRRGGLTQRDAVRAFDLSTVSGRRGGFGNARRVAEWIRPVRCRCTDAPTANPVANSRSRAVSSHDRPATGASLAHFSLRGERWVARRQARETLYKFGNNQPREKRRAAGARNA